MDGKMIFKFSKIKNNRLLNRVQMVVDVFHPNVQKVTKENIREYIRTHYKKPHVSLFGVKKFYGGGRTKGFVVVYDNEESMRKYEPTYRFKRMDIEKLAPADRKKSSGKKEGRKVLKVKKHQAQKKRGTVRKQEKRLAKKQGKKKK